MVDREPPPLPFHTERRFRQLEQNVGYALDAIQTRDARLEWLMRSMLIAQRYVDHLASSGDPFRRSPYELNRQIGEIMRAPADDLWADIDRRALALQELAECPKRTWAGAIEAVRRLAAEPTPEEFSEGAALAGWNGCLRAVLARLEPDEPRDTEPAIPVATCAEEH